MSTPPGPAPAAPQPQPADAVAPAPPDAVADLRATARWTIAAMAAVGTLLVGAGPLAAVGKIDDWGDALAAFGGLALAVFGIGWAIWHTTEALTPRIATLQTLDDPEMASLKREIDRNPSAFYGPYPSLGDLRAATRFHDSVAASAARRLTTEQNPARIPLLQRTLSDARANSAQARHLQSQLLVLVHAWSVRNAVRRARLHTLAAFALVSASTVLFLTATNDDTAADPKPSAPATRPAKP